MDEENSNVNRLDTVLGVQEDKSVGSKIKSFTKKLGKVPEVKTVDLKPRADFRKTNKELDKQLNKWRNAGKLHAGNPLINYFIGNKHKVKAIKRTFAELEKTAFKSNQKYQTQLNALLGNDRDKNIGKGFQYGGEIGDTKQAHDGAVKSIMEHKRELAELKKAYGDLSKQQKSLDLLPTEKEAQAKKETAQKRLNDQMAKRDTAYKKSADGAAGSAKIRAIMDQGAEWNKELSKLAAGYYGRTGDESLFDIVRTSIEAKSKEDEAEFKRISALLTKAQHQKAGHASRLSALLEQQKNNPNEDISSAIADTKGKLSEADSNAHLYSDQKKTQQKFVQLNEKRKAQFEHYYANKDKPQDFAKDQNFDTDQFSAKVDDRLRDVTAKYKELAEAMKSMTSSKELANIDADIQQALNAVKEAEAAAKNTRNEAQAENVKKQLDEKNKQIKEAEKNLQRERQNAEHLRNVFSDLHLQAKEIAKQLSLWKLDLSADPFKYEMQSDDAKKYNDIVQDIKSGVAGIGKNWKKSNVLTRLASRILLNIRSQIADMINPLTLFRKGWDAWLDRFDNLPWKNTFEVIAYNFTTAFAPVFEWFAKALLKVVQVINVFVMRWTGVDLFDKSAWQLEKMKKGMGQLTASFDELHSSNDNPNQFNTIFDTDPTAISPLSDETLKTLTNIADGIKTVWDKTIGFITEHPIASAIIGGAALLLGPKALGGLLLGAGKLIGKGAVQLGKLAWNGIKTVGPKIWNGVKTVGKKIIDPNTWKPVGTFFKDTGTKIAGFMGKGLYTGMNGATVTMGKFLGGTAMVATGVVTAGKSAIDAGKNWQDYNNAQKAVKVGGVALGSTLAGIGAVMLGASGPVGWAIGGAVALGSLTVGMFQVQDGIKSVKKEQEAWKTAQENLAIANENWNTAMYNATNALAQLEQLEIQTGISGEELYKSVQNGTLAVDDMTSAQLQVYNAYVQTKEATDQLKVAQQEKAKAEKAEADGMIRTALAARKKKDDYTEAKDAILQAVEEEKISTEEAAEYFSRLMGNMKKDAREALMEEIPEDIRQCVEPTKYASGWEKFGIGWNNFWSGVWEGTKQWVSDVGTSIHDGWENMKTKATEKWEEIKTNVGNKWEEMKTNAADTWENMKTKAGEKWDEIKNSAVGQKVQELATDVKTKWGELKTETTEKFQEIASKAKEKWENTKNEITTRASDAFTNAKEKWNQLKDDTETIFNNILTNTKTAFTNIANTISDKAKEAWEKAKGWFEDIGKKAKEAWDGVKNWGSNIGKGWEQEGFGGAVKATFGLKSYDVGTNYVPNDQLAMIHKGEAIIPAKYNKPYSPPSTSSNLESTVAAMTQEIANLRSLIQGGIPVKGEFKQRGSDLVAVVEKGKNKNGNQPLSNPAYAR